MPTTKRIYKNFMSNYSKFVLTEQKLKETDNREFIAEKPNAISALQVLLEEMTPNRDMAIIDGHNMSYEQVEALSFKLRKDFSER